MLYDRRWDQKVITHPSYEGMIAWLEAQPNKNQWYNFWSVKTCVLARYLQAIGAERPIASQKEIERVIGRHGATVVMNFPWTYRAALRRAKRYQHKINSY